MALKVLIHPVTAFMQNCSILFDDKTRECVLVDVGGNVDEIEEIVKENNLQVCAIWLTHGHVDHVGGVYNFIQKHKVPVIGPNKEDEFWINEVEEIAKNYGFPEKAKPFEPDRWLHDGEELEIGQSGIKFKVLEIPGHTPGSVVYYNEENQLLIAGDVIFYESIGRTDFPKGNHKDLLENIKKKIFTLPKETNIIPGHGPMTTVEHEIQYNPFLK